MKITYNAFYIFIARIINAFSILSVTLIISRTQGPEIFGGYSFLNTIIMTGIVLANYGTDTLMVREASREKQRANKYFTSTFIFKVISSLCVIITIIVVFKLVLNNQKIEFLLPYYSVVILLNALSQSLWFYADISNRFRLHATMWSFSNIIKVPFVYFFILTGEGLNAIILALIVSEFISFCISYYFVKKFLFFSFKSFLCSDIPVIFKKATPLAAVVVLSVILFRVDTLMLQILKEQKDVGFYSAAYKIFEFIGIIPSTICIILLPDLSESYVKEFQIFKKKILKMIVFLFFVGLTLSALLILLSNFIIHFLYGPEFFDSISCLKILSCVVLFMFFNGFFSYVAIAMNKENNIIIILSIVTACNILLNLYLIPKYSFNGAALATLVSEFFMFFSLFFIFKELFYHISKHHDINHS